MKIQHWWLKNKRRKVDFRFVERRFLAAINLTGSAEGALVPVFLRITHWTKSGVPVSPPGLFSALGLRSPQLRKFRFDSSRHRIKKPSTPQHRKSPCPPHERIELWTKSIKHFKNFGRHFPALHPQKSSQHIRACAARDGAIFSKNRRIVPYHRDSPNTRNGGLTVSVPDYGS